MAGYGPTLHEYNADAVVAAEISGACLDIAESTAKR